MRKVRMVHKFNSDMGNRNNVRFKIVLDSLYSEMAQGDLQALQIKEGKEMTTGNGIAIVGLWIGCGYLASSKTVSGQGMWLCLMVAFIVTLILK